VALISGRSITDIDRLAPDSACRRLDNTASSAGTPAGGSLAMSSPAQGSIGYAASSLRPLESHRGLALETRHVSGPPLPPGAPAGGFVHRLVRSLAARLGPQYCVQTGKRIVEMKPAGKDKAWAVSGFSRRSRSAPHAGVVGRRQHRRNTGFAMVNRLHGHSIKVGPGRTAARWAAAGRAGGHPWLSPMTTLDLGLIGNGTIGALVNPPERSSGPASTLRRRSGVCTLLRERTRGSRTSAFSSWS